MILAGRLNKRVTIQRATESRDRFGQAIKSWSDLATVWAQVTPLYGVQLEYAQKVNAQTTHRFTIRHYSGLSTKDRLSYDSRTFEILSVINEDEANVKHIVLAVEEN